MACGSGDLEEDDGHLGGKELRGRRALHDATLHVPLRLALADTETSALSEGSLPWSHKRCARQAEATT